MVLDAMMVHQRPLLDSAANDPYQCLKLSQNTMQGNIRYINHDNPNATDVYIGPCFSDDETKFSLTYSDGCRTPNSIINTVNASGQCSPITGTDVNERLAHGLSGILLKERSPRSRRRISFATEDEVRSFSPDQSSMASDDASSSPIKTRLQDGDRILPCVSKLPNDPSGPTNQVPFSYSKNEKWKESQLSFDNISLHTKPKSYVSSSQCQFPMIEGTDHQKLANDQSYQHGVAVEYGSWNFGKQSDTAEEDFCVSTFLETCAVADSDSAADPETHSRSYVSEVATKAPESITNAANWMYDKNWKFDLVQNGFHTPDITETCASTDDMSDYDIGVPEHLMNETAINPLVAPPTETLPCITNVSWDFKNAFDIEHLSFHTPEFTETCATADDVSEADFWMPEDFKHERNEHVFDECENFPNIFDAEPYDCHDILDFAAADSNWVAESPAQDSFETEAIARSIIPPAIVTSEQLVDNCWNYIVNQDDAFDTHSATDNVPILDPLIAKDFECELLMMPLRPKAQAATDVSRSSWIFGDTLDAEPQYYRTPEFIEAHTTATNEQGTGVLTRENFKNESVINSCDGRPNVQEIFDFADFAATGGPVENEWGDELVRRKDVKTRSPARNKPVTIPLKMEDLNNEIPTKPLTPETNGAECALIDGWNLEYDSESNWDFGDALDVEPQYFCAPEFVEAYTTATNEQGTGVLTGENIKNEGVINTCNGRQNVQEIFYYPDFSSTCWPVGNEMEDDLLCQDDVKARSPARIKSATIPLKMEDLKNEITTKPSMPETNGAECALINSWSLEYGSESNWNSRDALDVEPQYFCTPELIKAHTTANNEQGTGVLTRKYFKNGRVIDSCNGRQNVQEIFYSADFAGTCGPVENEWEDYILRRKDVKTHSPDRNKPATIPLKIEDLQHEVPNKPLAPETNEAECALIDDWSLEYGTESNRNFGDPSDVEPQYFCAPEFIEARTTATNDQGTGVLTRENFKNEGVINPYNSSQIIKKIFDFPNFGSTCGPVDNEWGDDLLRRKDVKTRSPARNNSGTICLKMEDLNDEFASKPLMPESNEAECALIDGWRLKSDVDQDCFRLADDQEDLWSEAATTTHSAATKTLAATIYDESLQKTRPLVDYMYHDVSLKNLLPSGHQKYEVEQAGNSTEDNHTDTDTDTSSQYSQSHSETYDEMRYQTHAYVDNHIHNQGPSVSAPNAHINESSNRKNRKNRNRGHLAAASQTIYNDKLKCQIADTKATVGDSRFRVTNRDNLKECKPFTSRSFKNRFRGNKLFLRPNARRQRLSGDSWQCSSSSADEASLKLMRQDHISADLHHHGYRARCEKALAEVCPPSRQDSAQSLAIEVDDEGCLLNVFMADESVHRKLSIGRKVICLDSDKTANKLRVSRPSKKKRKRIKTRPALFFASNSTGEVVSHKDLFEQMSSCESGAIVVNSEGCIVNIILTPGRADGAHHSQ